MAAPIIEGSARRWLMRNIFIGIGVGVVAAEAWWRGYCVPRIEKRDEFYRKMGIDWLGVESKTTSICRNIVKDLLTLSKSNVHQSFSYKTKLAYRVGSRVSSLIMMASANHPTSGASSTPTSGISNSIAITRLTEERKQWRKDHPFGFYAKPLNNADGTANLMVWECGIPGKANSLWEGGVYKLKVVFPESYPSSAPKCQFTPPIPHPNIFPSGYVCLSLLNAGWKPAITLKQVLLGIQQLFEEPNLKSPANHDMYMLYRENKKKYEEMVKAFARRHTPTA